MDSLIITTFVDSTTSLTRLLSSIAAVFETITVTDAPFLFIDLEGTNLSRKGSISLLQILVKPTITGGRSSSQIFIVDVQTLQDAAFSTTIPRGRTSLRSILEASNVTKVIFDVRNDSDALYAHYGISLAGVVDLQLMEYVTRRPHTSEDFKNKQIPFYNRLRGLAGCIEDHSGLSRDELRNWMLVKRGGTAMFDAKQGGSYEVFKQRPLSEALLKYSAGDVRFMSILYDVYAEKMDSSSWQRVSQESTRRVQLSQQVDYDAHGKDKGKGPWTCTKQRSKQVRSPRPSSSQKAVKLSSDKTNSGSRNADEKRHKAAQPTQHRQNISRSELHKISETLTGTQSSKKGESPSSHATNHNPDTVYNETSKEESPQAEPTSSSPPHINPTAYRTMPLRFKQAQDGFLSSTFNKTNHVLILPPVGKKQTKPTQVKNNKSHKRKKVVNNGSTVLPTTTTTTTTSVKAASVTSPAPPMSLKAKDKVKPKKKKQSSITVRPPTTSTNIRKTNTKT